MDINNKEEVQSLMTALDAIDDLKNKVANLHARVYTMELTALGLNVLNIALYFPAFKDRLPVFLDGEKEYIEERLKEL